MTDRFSHNAEQVLVYMYVCSYKCSAIGISNTTYTEALLVFIMHLMAMHKPSEKSWNIFLQKQHPIKSTTKQIGVKRISRVTNCSLQKNRPLHSCLSRTVTYFKSNFFAKQGQMATSANSIYNSLTMKNFHVYLNLKF